jgi:hypothetical protein
VTTAGALALDYDPAGRMIARGSHAFAYDHRGRLRTVSQGDAVVGRAFYGASQRRVLSLVGGRRTYELTPALDVQDGLVRLRFGAGAHATVEVQSDAAMGELFPSAAADGNINAADGFAAGSASGGDDANAVLAASARRLLLGPDGRQTSWRVLDQLGSTVAVADANGAVTERIDYQPLGAVRASTAGRTEFASFTGRDFDDATGFLDLEARLFSPTEGRFLTPDDAFAGFTADQLLQLTDAAGVYSYCGGNPVSFVDSTGNQLESATYYARHAHREWGYRGGSAAKAVEYFSLMLIVQGRDAARSAREQARSFIQIAAIGFLSSVGFPKASEATARRENTRAVSLSDKGVDPVASSSSSASSELSSGQRVKGLHARTQAKLGAFIRTGPNIDIEQRLRAYIKAKTAAKKRIAGQKAVRAQWTKNNKVLAVKKGAAPGRARR